MEYFCSKNNNNNNGVLVFVKNPSAEFSERLNAWINYLLISSYVNF